MRIANLSGRPVPITGGHAVDPPPPPRPSFRDSAFLPY